MSRPIDLLAVSPGDLPDPGIQSMTPASPALQAESLSVHCLGNPSLGIHYKYS